MNNKETDFNDNDILIPDEFVPDFSKSTDEIMEDMRKFHDKAMKAFEALEMGWQEKNKKELEKEKNK